MIERQPFNELAGEDRGWLRAKRHFSFAAARMVWGSLRVWNDDEIAPSAGFPPHTALALTGIDPGVLTGIDPPARSESASLIGPVWRALS
jgi:hypothetical protein